MPKKIKINKQKRLFLISGIFSLFFSLFFSSLSEASINRQINYQGKLTNLSDVAVANGNYDMVIRIYRVSDGSCLWSARGNCGAPTARSVQVTSGIFSIALGDTTAGDNAIDLNFNEDYELGIKVGADNEMAPRKKLASVPQAFNAGNLITDGIIDIDNTGTSADAANISYNPASGTNSALSIAYGSSGGTGIALKVVQSGTGKIMGLFDGATEVFTVLDGGNVGIGTTAPTALLSLAASTASRASLNIASGTAPTVKNNGDMWFDGTHLYLGIGGSPYQLDQQSGGSLPSGIEGQTLYNNAGTWTATSALFFDDVSSNVGIGITAPTALLSLAASTASRASLNIAASASVDPSSPGIGDIWFNGANLFFRKDSSTNVDLLTSVGSQWTTFGTDIYYGSDVVGSVGIGTTAPGAVLEINGGMREKTGLKIANLDLANYAIDLSASGLAGSEDYYLYMNGASTYWRSDGEIKTPGAVTSSAFYDYANGGYFLDPDNATTSLKVAGKVGIGTMNPDNMLSINMQNGDPILDFRVADSTIFSMGVDDSDNDKFKIEYGSVLGNANPALVISANGQIGMGTDTPDNSLTLNRPAGYNSIIDFMSNGTSRFSIGIDDADNDKFKIQSGSVLGGSAPALAIDASSQIGIGTNAPETLVHLKGGHLTLDSLNNSTAAEVRFREGYDNGTNYISFKAPDDVGASSYTFVLPNSYGTNGQVLQTSGAGILSWSNNAATGMSNPMTTIGDLIYASTTATPANPSRLAIGSAGQCLVVSGGLPAWGACSSTSAAAGATTQVQFNNAGSLGASASFTWDNTNLTLSSLGTIAGAKISLALQNTSAGTTSSNELRVGNDTTANALSLLVNSSAFTGAVNYAYIYNKTATGQMLFGTNNTERMRINAAGNVGIGMTNPSTKLHVVDNAVTTGNAILATSTSLTAGSLMSLQSTGTAAASNTQTVLNIATSGANGTATQTTYGLQVSNTHTGTTVTNVGGYFVANSASAASVNYSLRTGAMTSITSYGLDVGALSGATTNVGINIGNISTGATSDYGILIGTIAGGGVGSALTTGAVSTTGATATQINLGAISGNNATSHTGVAIGAISGTTANAYGLTTSTITGGSTSNNAILTGAISGTATNSYGVRIGTITGGTTANYGVSVGVITTTGATSSYGVHVAAPVGTGTNKYALYSAGITASSVSTNIGLYLGAISGSTGASTNAGIQLVSVAGAATNAYGMNLGTVTGGTTANYSVLTGAVSGTTVNAYGLNIGTVTGGTTGNYGVTVGAVTSVASATNYGINISGTTGTAASSNNYGARIASLASTGTANYGLNVLQPSGATHDAALEIGTVATTAGDWAIYSSSTAVSYFAGNVGFGVTAPTYPLQTGGGNVAIGPVNTSTSAQLRLLEGSTNGTDYVALKAADSVTSAYTLTFPSALGANGQILQTDNSGILSWANNAATGMSNPMTTTGDMIYSSSGTTPARRAIGSTGQCLVVSGGLPTWGSCSGTAAAGSDTQVIYNSAGAFAGAAEFIWNNTNKTLSSLGAITGAKVSLALRNTSTGTASTNELQIGNDATANTLSLLVNSSLFTSYGNYAYIQNKANAPLILGSNNTERLRLDAAGNIGIGNAFSAVAPTSLLDVTRNAIGSTESDAYGISLVNTTAAANNAQQYSPPLRFRGFGWNTSASQSVDMRMYLRPIQAATVTGALDFQSNIAGAGYTDVMTIMSNGRLGVGTNTPTAKLHVVDSTVTTGNSLLLTSATLTSGSLVSLTGTSTATAANQTILNISNSGTNGTASMTSYGMQVSNTHAGTTPTNIAALFTATGATTNYALRVAAMTGATSYGLDIGALSGSTTNVGINIGNISAGATTDSAITIGTIAGGGIGSALTTGAVSTTGATATQINLGAISGANATSHTGVAIGAISGVTANAYGLTTSTLTGGTTANYGISVGAITSTNATTSYGISVAALIGTGASKYAFYSGGLTSTTTSTNNIGIYMGAISGSTAATTNTGIQVASVAGVGTNNYGINLGTLTGGTTANYGIAIGAITTTGATNSHGISIGALGGTGTTNSALTIATITATGTTDYGINISGLSGASTTNNGIYIGTVSGSTNKYSIQTAGITGTAASVNTGLKLGAIASSTTTSVNTGIDIGAISSTSGTGTNRGILLGNISGAATNAYGITLGTLTGGTTSNSQLNTGAVTAVASASNYNLNLGGITGTAASSTNYGINIGTLNSTGTNNYGIYLSTPSGASNNYYIYGAVGAYLSTAGTWTNAPSYRRYKDNFTDTSSYLDALMTLDVNEWQYKNEEVDGVNRYVADSDRHASPFLDDFYNTFHLGRMDGVNVQDMAGVALASIKELNTRFVDERETLNGLDLMTSQNIFTLAQLQSVVETNFTKIETELTEEESRLKSAEVLLADQQSQIQDLRGQMELLKTENQAMIDFAVALNLKALVYKDVSGNLDLGNGKLEADGVVAGAFTVKIVDPEMKTIGEEIIRGIEVDYDENGIDDETGSDGKSVLVKTKAANEAVKIFISPKSKTALRFPLTVTQIEVGEYFKVEIPEITIEDIGFDWWIVNEKGSSQ